MNKKNITPNPKQPVDRVPAGQLPSALAELTEATLDSGTLGAKPSSYGGSWGACGERVRADLELEGLCYCSFEEGEE